MISARLWPSRQDDAAPPRTPSLRQVHDSECGVIALAIVLAHYGAWVPLPDLRRQCDVSESGVTALSLVRAGQHYGLNVRAIRLGVEAMGHLNAPVILFWENQHFLVLEGIHGQTAWVNDPARGHRTLSLDQLAQGYSGVALLTKPGPEFVSMGRPRPPLRTMLALLRPARAWLLAMGAATIAEATLAPLALTGTRRLAPRRGPAAFQSLAAALGGLAAASAVRRWTAARARNAIIRETQLMVQPGDAAHREDKNIPAPGILAHPRLADYPATTAVRIATAGVRMLVAVPALVAVVARTDAAAGVILCGSLLTSTLAHERSARIRATSAATRIERVRVTSQPVDAAANANAARRPAEWKRLRIAPHWLLVLAPAVVVATRRPRPSGTSVDLLVTVAASGFGLGIVETSARAFGTLDALPEAIVQLQAASEPGGNTTPPPPTSI